MDKTQFDMEVLAAEYQQKIEQDLKKLGVLSPETPILNPPHKEAIDYIRELLQVLNTIDGFLPNIIENVIEKPTQKTYITFITVFYQFLRKEQKSNSVCNTAIDRVLKVFKMENDYNHFKDDLETGRFGQRLLEDINKT